METIPGPEPEAKEETTPEEMPLLDHMEELRGVLIRACIGLLISFLLCYFFSEQIMAIIQKPLMKVLPPGQQKLYFTNPLEKFWAFLKISGFCGVALSAPWVLYQLWTFVAPGLYNRERRFVGPMVAGGSILFVSGAIFAYFLVLPTGLEVLMSFGGSMEGALITYANYVDVVLITMGIFGLVFQVPLIIFLGLVMGLFSVKVLRKYRPHIYVGLSIAAAILTPPDPFSMMAMFLPLVLLFEVSLVVFSWWKKS